MFSNMKSSLLITMALSATLLTACAGNEAARMWASLPVSEHSDAAELAASLKACPAEWKAAAEFLSREDLDVLPLGRYDLTPEGTYANIQEYDTRFEGDYELHRAYADVQVVLSGEEHIFVAPRTSVRECRQEYDAAKDIEFYASATDEIAVPADRSHWVVLFPSDAHKPCMSIGAESVHIRKIVVKVKL